MVRVIFCANSIDRTVNHSARGHGTVDSQQILRSWWHHIWCLSLFYFQTQSTKCFMRGSKTAVPAFLYISFSLDGFIIAVERMSGGETFLLVNMGQIMLF